MISYSIIIPHKNSLDTLPRLFKGIPERSDIEILLVDNSEEPITKEQVGVNREYQLLWSQPERFAGGARNVGVEHAVGKWLIFVDADDFLLPEAFTHFDKYLESDYDLIYFKSESVYDDTLEQSDRNVMFNGYVERFIRGEMSELDCRLAYLVPWGKMVRRELVLKNNIKFDEVLAANDVMFSTLTGFYSEKFTVDENPVYVITTRRASLANRWDLPVVEARYTVALRRNQFLKAKGLRDNQGSVMLYFYKVRQFGARPLLHFLWLAIKYRQNIFIGAGNWIGTFKRIQKNEDKNEKYLVKK